MSEPKRNQDEHEQDESGEMPVMDGVDTSQASKPAVSEAQRKKVEQKRWQYRKKLGDEGYAQMLAHEFSSWLKTVQDKDHKDELDRWLQVLQGNKEAGLMIASEMAKAVAQPGSANRELRTLGQLLDGLDDKMIPPQTRSKLLHSVTCRVQFGQVSVMWAKRLAEADTSAWPREDAAKAQAIAMTLQADRRRAKEGRKWNATALRDGFRGLPKAISEMSDSDRAKNAGWLSNNLREVEFNSAEEAEAVIALFSEMHVADLEATVGRFIDEHISGRDLVSQVRTLAAFADVALNDEEPEMSEWASTALERVLAKLDAAVIDALREHLKLRPGASLALTAEAGERIEELLVGPTLDITLEGAPRPVQSEGARVTSAAPAQVQSESQRGRSAAPAQVQGEDKPGFFARIIASILGRSGE